MQAGPVLPLLLFAFNVFTFNVAQGQSPHQQSGGPAQGSLRVTVTVEPSVWLMMTPDGKQETIVANAPDPKESFFHVPSLKNGLKKQKMVTAHPFVAIPQTQELGRQGEAAVQFSLLVLKKLIGEHGFRSISP
jgi:hypothetical protein